MPIATEMSFPRLELVNPDDANRLPEGYLARALKYEHTLDWPDLSVGGNVFMWLIRCAQDITSSQVVCFALNRAGHPVYVGNELGHRPKLLCANTGAEVDIN